MSSPKEKEEAPAAAEGEGAEGEGAAKKGKKKLLFIIIGVVLLLVIGGVLASGILGGGEKKESGEEVEGDSHAAAESKDDGHGSKDNGHGGGGGHGEEGKVDANKPVYYELPQFLVNLSTNNGRVSFIKMSVTLELKNHAASGVIDANKPRVVDLFNTYLRELRASDVEGSAGVYRLRDELLARLNATIEGETVKDVLFTELIVQ